MQVKKKGFDPTKAVRIFLHFEKMPSAVKALVDLNNRFFGGRQITAQFYDQGSCVGLSEHVVRGRSRRRPDTRRRRRPHPGLHKCRSSRSRVPVSRPLRPAGARTWPRRKLTLIPPPLGCAVESSGNRNKGK